LFRAGNRPNPAGHGARNSLSEIIVASGIAGSKNNCTFAVLKSKINPSAAMAKKGNRVQVIMECTEHKNSGLPGTSRYITTKNRKNTPERIELKKFNPIMRKMTVHKEIK
jgi:large subunit ribosomal protein L33